MQAAESPTWKSTTASGARPTASAKSASVRSTASTHPPDAALPDSSATADRGPLWYPDPVRTYVDRGGTFTDLVLVDPDGRARVRKVRSDRAVVGELAQGTLTFGTTVATNAL